MDAIVLIPTLHRPKGLRRTLQSLKDTCGLPSSVAADPDDLEAQEIAEEFGAIFTFCPEIHLGGAAAWNVALKAAPDHEAYFLGSDDILFMPGWWEEVLDTLAKQLNGSGFVCINDGRKNAEKFCGTHYLMTRDFIVEHNGGVAASPFYFCDWTDMEADRRARKAKKWAWAQKASVKHLWLGPTGDEGYRRAYAQRKNVRPIYEERERLGFPNNFEPIIK